MKELILVRHATAAWGQASNSDFDRVLTAQGEEGARRVGAHLATLQPAPQLLVSSPARRAEQTAQAVFDALALSADHWRREERIYEAETRTLLSLCHSMDDAVDRIVWVGHNPGLHDLARLLSRQAPPGLPPGGVVHLCFESDSWMSVDDDAPVRTEFTRP